PAAPSTPPSLPLLDALPIYTDRFSYRYRRLALRNRVGARFNNYGIALEQPGSGFVLQQHLHSLVHRQTVNISMNLDSAQLSALDKKLVSGLLLYGLHNL